MKTYFYKAPLSKSSIQMCEVTEQDGKLIGSVQRYFNSFIHRIIDLLIGRNNLIVRVKATNPEGRIVIDANTKMAMIKKPYYYLHFLNGDWKGITFRAKQTNNVNINPEFLIKSEVIEIFAESDMFDGIRFYQEGRKIAKWHSRAKDKLKTYIEVEKNASVQDPLFYAVLGQMLYFIGY